MYLKDDKIKNGIKPPQILTVLISFKLTSRKLIYNQWKKTNQFLNF